MMSFALVPKDGLQAGAILLHRARHFGRLHIDRALGGSFAHEARHVGSVLFRIDAGAHLDGGSLEGHGLSSVRKHRVELACALERMQIVAAADMLVVDEDLRKGGAAVRLADHFLPKLR